MDTGLIVDEKLISLRQFTETGKGSYPRGNRKLSVEQQIDKQIQQMSNAEVEKNLRGNIMVMDETALSVRDISSQLKANRISIGSGNGGDITFQTFNVRRGKSGAGKQFVREPVLERFKAERVKTAKQEIEDFSKPLEYTYVDLDTGQQLQVIRKINILQPELAYGKKQSLNLREFGKKAFSYDVGKLDGGFVELKQKRADVTYLVKLTERLERQRTDIYGANLQSTTQKRYGTYLKTGEIFNFGKDLTKDIGRIRKPRNILKEIYGKPESKLQLVSVKEAPQQLDIGLTDKQLVSLKELTKPSASITLRQRPKPVRITKQYATKKVSRISQLSIGAILSSDMVNARNFSVNRDFGILSPVNVRSPISARINPLISPSIRPTIQPTIRPQISPLIEPTIQPMIQPLIQPQIQPMVQARIQPQIQPRMNIRQRINSEPYIYPRPSKKKKPILDFGILEPRPRSKKRSRQSYDLFTIKNRRPILVRGGLTRQSALDFGARDVLSDLKATFFIKPGKGEGIDLGTTGEFNRATSEGLFRRPTRNSRLNKFSDDVFVQKQSGRSGGRLRSYGERTEIQSKKRAKMEKYLR